MQRVLSFILSYLLIVFGWKRSVVHANLFLVRSEFPPSFAFNRWHGREKLYRKLIRNLTREFLFLLFNRRARIESISERAQVLIPKMQNGGMMLTAHFGNWEYMGPWLRRLGVPLLASYAPLKNRKANTILKKLRDRNGNYTFALNNTALPLRKLIRNRNLFAFLADQDFRGQNSGSPSEFFHQAIRTSPIPESYLCMSSAPVYFAWVTRQDLQTLCLDAVELPADSFFTHYHHQLEQLILEYPEQYFGWTHRRFLSTSKTLYQQF